MQPNSRRTFLRWGAASALGASLPAALASRALAAGTGTASAAKSPTGPVLHPAVHGGRPQPHRHLRPQARPPDRRHLQGHRHQRRGRAGQRAPAPPGRTDETPGAHPLADLQGGQPRPRPPPDAHQLRPRRRRRPPGVRLAGGRGPRRRHRRPARLRVHRRPGRGLGLPVLGPVAVPGEEPAAPGSLPGAGPGHRRRALRQPAGAAAQAGGSLRRWPGRTLRQAVAATWASRPWR